MTHAIAVNARSPAAKSRRAQILEAAITQFHERGFHGVGVDDIAGAVGITGGGLYRHFRNKDELLAETVLVGVQRLEAAAHGVSDSSQSLDDFVVAMASITLRERQVGVLLLRESRHLAPSALEAVESRIDALVERFTLLLMRERPDLDHLDAKRLIRSVFSVLYSPAFHTFVLPRGQGESLLVAMARRLLLVSGGLVPSSDLSTMLVLSRGSEVIRVPERASMREMLRDAAVPLFARRGYHGVRMEDIGASVGITGPSLYTYFADKMDLLVAVLTRGLEWLLFEMDDALKAASSPWHGIELILDSYVGFRLKHSELIGLLFSEPVYLPSEQRRIQLDLSDYLGEWVRLLTMARPELSTAQAWFMTHAVLALVAANARGDGGQIDPTVQPCLINLCLYLLQEDSASASPI